MTRYLGPVLDLSVLPASTGTRPFGVPRWGSPRTRNTEGTPSRYVPGGMTMVIAGLVVLLLAVALGVTGVIANT